MRTTLTFLLLASTLAARAQDDAGAQFFESKIRPLLVENCYGCHSAQAKKLKANLRLDSRDAALKGGESGPALVVGAPEKSRLIESVGYKNVDLQMPPKDKLSDRQIADLTAWVKMGAPWGHETTAAVAEVEAFDLARRKSRHWAWQPVRPQPSPAVKDGAWPKDPVDHFILAKLEASNLRPAPPADPRTLVRRAYFTLIGLPPKPEEVEAFVNDSSPAAFEAVVDRLLASPAFGERWGRHWLDLVRYAETMGHEFDFAIPNAWRYRDYVIRALNADLPYDRFLTEQIAGDILTDPRRAADGTNESAIGTGFYFFGEDVQAPVDVRQHQADLFDNRIDVLGKSMLGLTIACARCHDHKFDAISAADYYAFYGYLKGTRYAQHTLNDREIGARVGELRRIKETLRVAVGRNALARLGQPAGPLEVVVATSPARPGDVEFSQGTWSVDGAAFSSGDPGDFKVGDERRPVAAFAGRAKVHSGLLSDRLEGAIRSPAVTLDKRYLHVRASGANVRLNVVVDNFNVIRDPIYGSLKRGIKSDKPNWFTIDLNMWQGREAYLEFLDNSVPDPGGSGAAPNGHLALERALLSDHPKPPASTDAAESVPTELLRATLEMWVDGSLKSAPDAPRRAAILSRALDQNLLDVATDDVASLIREYRRVESTIPAPAYALAAADGSTDDEHLFIRGNPKNLGPKIPRRFLEALTPSHSSVITPRSSFDSGRLSLAKQITSPGNPLTARVMANRVWHYLFGRGIVASVDNFGVLGDVPTHPELLDHLADRFVKDGWSVKRLIRAIVLSRTWQQSSTSADPAFDAADPDNKLLHRANVRRLEAETLRDHLLAVSGRLDSKRGGPSVPIHLTPFMEGRGKPERSGPLDGAGRRSIYLEVRRNFLPPMLLAFDTPTPFNTMGRRSVSNVPAQALILMNDPFVVGQAKLWAARTLADASATPEQRIGRMYQTAFSRPPTAVETKALLTFLDEQGALEGIAPSERATSEQLWTDLAHALINTKEFIFLN